MIPLRRYPPKDIANTIKESIVGQDIPARTVATALSAHLSRCIHNQKHPDNPIRKDNLIILGPTGTGKTETVRTVINKLDLPIPLTIASCTTLTNAGYIGKSVDDILYDLLQDATKITKEHPGSYFNFKTIEPQPEQRSIGFMSELIKPKTKKINKEQSEKIVKELCNCGIVILDEFDKLRYSSKNEHEAVYSRKLQAELLKIVEGTKDISESEVLSGIDTKDILFIAMGAFSGLLCPNDAIPSAEEIVQYGFLEELIGRFSLRCKYNQLTDKDLFKILTTSDISPVHDFQRLFSEGGNQLRFDKTSLQEIALKASFIDTGARALRTVMSDFLYPLFYEVEGKYINHQIHITRAVVNGKKPTIRPIPANNNNFDDIATRDYK